MINFMSLQLSLLFLLTIFQSNNSPNSEKLVSLNRVSEFSHTNSYYKNPKSEIPNPKYLINSDSNILRNNFINAIFNLSYSDNTGNIWLGQSLLKQKHSLHFNAAQVYDKINDDKNGTERFGKFNTSLSQMQKENITALNDSIAMNDMSAFIERSKISKPCYAQRLIYEAEGDSNFSFNYGFSYMTVTAPVEYDDDRRVVYCTIDSDNTPRYICENIYENLQHCDLPYFNLQYADNGIWYLKPMLKIDSSIVDSEPEKPVVRIDIINYSGDTIKEIELKAKNFKDENGNYNGEYIEVYTGLPFNKELEISGSNDSPSGLSYGIDYDNWQSWDTACHIDFKIWWYGQIDVWFDKMTVDDKWADELFKGIHDVKIEEEIIAYRQNGWDFIYFIDEIVASSVPCIKHVKKKINNRVKFSCSLNNWLNVHGMKNDAIAHELFMKEVKPEVFSCDVHEIPNPLPSTLGNVPYHGAELISPSDYVSFMQFKFGHKNAVSLEQKHGSFIYMIELARKQSNEFSSGAKLIMQPQLHGWMHKNNSTGEFRNGGREPLNEEIEAQAMLSLTHGADGLCWFIFQSLKWKEPEILSKFGNAERIPDSVFMFGLLNVNDTTERHKNLYGQDKWNFMTLLNLKLLQWKPTLDKIKWIKGYSTYVDWSKFEYFEDIKSIFRDSIYPFIFNPLNFDNPNNKFWEAGFFEPDPEFRSIENDRSKYFLTVNRRTVPETIPGARHLRQLKIKFNGDNLHDFERWEIIDLSTNQRIATINKNEQEYIDFGVFQPGEGKLYKLTPVM